MVLRWFTGGASALLLLAAAPRILRGFSVAFGFSLALAFRLRFGRWRRREFSATLVATLGTLRVLGRATVLVRARTGFPGALTLALRLTCKSEALKDPKNYRTHLAKQPEKINSKPELWDNAGGRSARNQSSLPEVAT